LLLSEASDGNLQTYLEANYDTIPFSLRQKWCRQVVESISYIHRQGIIHSDLRPDNYLVHATQTSLDLWLCDFGGSFSEKLGVDGKQLPDPGFFDPNAEWRATKANDLFSVGSVLYGIVAGHWPHRDPGPFESVGDSYAYDARVERLFKNQEYPDVAGLFGGHIIFGCWTRKYASADDVLQALDQEIRLTSECVF
jgi:serine/threonine protein kinase